MATVLRAQELDLDLEEQSFTCLINHIMFEHHLFLRTELPLMSEAIHKNMLKFGGRYKVLIKLHSLFQKLKGELEQHLFEEEEQVFPTITDFARTQSFDKLIEAKQAIGDMELAHARVSSSLLAIRLTTSHYLVPSEEGQVLKPIYNHLIRLETKLQEHIRVENDILFPRVRRHEI